MLILLVWVFIMVFVPFKIGKEGLILDTIKNKIKVFIGAEPINYDGSSYTLGYSNKIALHKYLMISAFNICLRAI